MTETEYKASCDDCEYSYQHPRRKFVVTSAMNHQKIEWRDDLDHDYTITEVPV